MPTSRLIVAASETDADLLYATGFMAHDAFAWVKHRGRTHVLLYDVDLDRGRKEARADEIHVYSEVAANVPGGLLAPYASVLAAFLRRLGVKRVEVPARFPLGLAAKLDADGIAVKAVDSPFFPGRLRKTEEEMVLLRRAIRLSEIGLARATEVLRASDASGKSLRWAGKTLTSEILRAEIDSAILRAGGHPANTIVAGGRQACDPHERGRGPLRPGQLIVLDVFPRDPRTGFYGDLTRTVCRGCPTDAARRMWETVLEGQRRVLRAVRPGANGAIIHEVLKAWFAERGYPTGMRGGRNVGFFHGTGHGLGLDLHEEPRFSKCRFEPGSVQTVEPGLYYPGIGGCRHEDVIVVTEDGCRVLSRFPHRLEL